MFIILNSRKKSNKKILKPTKDNGDFAVNDPNTINSKFKINNSSIHSIPDDINNIQPEHSEIALIDFYVL